MNYCNADSLTWINKKVKGKSIAWSAKVCLKNKIDVEIVERNDKGFIVLVSHPLIPQREFSSLYNVNSYLNQIDKTKVGEYSEQ